MTTRYLTDAAGEKIEVVDVDGYLVPKWPPGNTPEQYKQNLEYIRHFKCRDDDVMLLSYPKTGTNWVNELIMMLLNNSTEKLVPHKVTAMLEFQTQDRVDTLPSPRCLNTHLTYKFLPKELKEKQLRTVLVARNPKDTLVSYFNHLRGIRLLGYNGTWEDWIQLYMKGEMTYGMYSDYLKEFEKAMAEGIGFPFHMLYYEDLKQSGLEEVKKLAKFLGVDASEDLCQKILDKCSFESMKNKETNSGKSDFDMFHDGFQFFRKGQIGDWKNWFTVAENEQFDQFWEKEMVGSKITFTYEQN